MSRGYASHCGRKIVSMKWTHCPFCGENLQSQARLPEIPVASGEICDAIASKGNVKGLKCVRPKNHSGKHRYQSKMPVLAATMKRIDALQNDDQPLFDF